jgi:hypothetical protein
MSLLKRDSTVAVLASTIEPSAVTITVSCTPPTGSVRSRVTVPPAATSMSARETFLKPSRLAVTVYRPGGRLRKM